MACAPDTMMMDRAVFTGSLVAMEWQPVGVDGEASDRSPTAGEICRHQMPGTDAAPEPDIPAAISAGRMR
jgi:hypothetical protein